MDKALPRAARLQPEDGWSALFWRAFRHSKNAMVLLDEQRRHVEVNGAYVHLLGHQRQALLGRPIQDFRAPETVASAREWRAALAKADFTGRAELIRADGRRLGVEYAGHPERVTGRQLVLFVVLASRAGPRADQGRPTSGGRSLTDRERQVVWLIATGHSGPEIADELQLAHNTVRTHVRNAMSKLGARSRAHLVAIAVAKE